MDYTELDAFLQEIDYVSKEVQGIVSGKIDVQDSLKAENARRAHEEHKKAQELEAKLQEEKDKEKGKAGKGIKFENYKSYCLGCCREFERERELCYVCGRKCISNVQRKKDLMSKVEELKKEKTLKADRKYRWEN